MNKRIISLVAGACLLVAAGSRAETPPPAKPATAPAQKAVPRQPWDELKQGDPAAKVKKLLGNVVETRPMKAPNGKAEVWVFLQEVSRRVDRIDRSTADVVINVTESDGSVRQRVTPGQVRFEDVQYVTEDVVEVLMFNDHYVLHKVSRQERKL